MTDIAIRCEGLGKQYRIGERESYKALRDTIADAAGAPFRLLRSRLNGAKPARANGHSTFWALKDLSFEIKRGEVVGVIGRNGAGKSTLLKILSRITAPTAGEVEIRGRVGSLLEVGTGFHPELTGRENIYLNGAILGMRKAEIERKFDEIVAFAEIEKFIDTPVKRYSSGMYVRLAFAVAAHLEPEILVVDEVLAVGDAQFQKKCLGKMGDVAKRGRTVLFVSHNMAAIKGLCDSAYLLSEGRVEQSGEVDAVVRKYLAEADATGESKAHWQYRHRGRRVSIEGVELLVNDRPSRTIQSGDKCTLRVRYRALRADAIGSDLSVSLMLYSEGQKLVNLWTNYHKGTSCRVLPRGYVECVVPSWPFRSHQMRLDVYTHTGLDVQDWIEECLVFDSHDGDYYGSGVVTNQGQGIMFLKHRWFARQSH